LPVVSPTLVTGGGSLDGSLPLQAGPNTSNTVNIDVETLEGLASLRCIAFTLWTKP